MRLLRNHFVKIKNKFQSIYKKYGWKAVIGIFAYYLVRDITLYIIIPYYVLAKD